MDTNFSTNASYFREPKAADSTLVASAEVEQLHNRHSASRMSSVHSRGQARETLGSGFETGDVRPYVRQLGVADVPAIEEHLLKLATLDRRARFLSHTADEVISDYVRRLDPFRAVLIGAFDLSERVVGLAEANPTVGTRKAEAAITVDVAFRRRGLGRQLVARALGLAFALGVQSVEFNFLPGNRALVRLVQSLGGRIGPTFDYASIDRTANWIGSAEAA